MTSPTDEAHVAGPSLPHRPRRRWVSWLLALLLLMSGAGIGSGLTALAMVRGVQHRLRHPEEFAARATARLRRFLDLTDQQAIEVEAALRTRQAALQKIRREVQPQVEEELRLLQAEVAASLTPDQADKWNRWFEQKRQTWLAPPPPPAG